MNTFRHYLHICGGIKLTKKYVLFENLSLYALDGNYIFVKGGHFRTEAFVKAVKRARLRGSSYDDAVDKWLTANQKKYGYTYRFDKK